MICRWDARTLELRDLEGGAWAADLSPFAGVAAVRLAPDGRRLAVTGTLEGDSLPSVRGAERGRQGLFLVQLDGTPPRRLRQGWASDPAWFPDASRLAFYSGKGLASVAADGSDEREHLRLGRFSWGPPSVSVSPGGSRLACVRWKGDDRHIATAHLPSGEARVQRPSCHHYAWFDEKTIAYDLGAGIRLLDVDSGRTSAWLESVAALAARAPAVLDLAPGLRPAVAGAPDTFSRVSQAQRAGDRVFFSAWVASGAARFDAILSLTPQGRDPALHLATDRGRVTSYALLRGGRLVCAHVETADDRLRLSTSVEWAGEGAADVPSGWLPLPERPAPELGFDLAPLVRGES